MPRTDLIAFLDLETTGVDESLDNIIEVGISLISWPGCEEVESFTSIVTPDQLAWSRMNGKDVVREMHKINGLYDEISHLMVDTVDAFAHLPKIVDANIHAWLKPYGNMHIPLGGSGVTHFDRRFIKKYLPKLDKHLSHYALDVGVERRLYEMVGATPAPNEGKTHRAIDDARVHAQEFKVYTDNIRRLKQYDDMAADGWSMAKFDLQLDALVGLAPITPVIKPEDRIVTLDWVATDMD